MPSARIVDTKSCNFSLAGQLQMYLKVVRPVFQIVFQPREPRHRQQQRGKCRQTEHIRAVSDRNAQHPHVQSAAEVVSPLIWFFELNSTELQLSTAVPMIAAAESTGNDVPPMTIHWSSSAVTVLARLMSINVRSPAEWRLLERSQPTMAASSTETATRKMAHHAHGSMGPCAQQPGNRVRCKLIHMLPPEK